jgi:hypothetical protein
VRNLAVGKRIALEIHIPGESAAWSAVGRVVWVRGEAEAATAGMGVKFIDVDDAASDAFERLRARSAGGPVVATVEDESAPASESGRASVPFELSKRKTAATSEEHAAPLSEQSSITKARSGWTWIAALVVAAIAGVSVYVFFTRGPAGDRHDAASPHGAASPAAAPPSRSPTVSAPASPIETAIWIDAGDASRPPSSSPVVPSARPPARMPPNPSGLARSPSGPSSSVSAQPVPLSPRPIEAGQSPATATVRAPATEDSTNPY